VSRDEAKFLPRIAVVTGASRGVGKGIALALGRAGMTVYVTGRSTSESLGSLKGVALGGSLRDTASQIDEIGGKGIAVQCDHRDDAMVKALFERVANEAGRLDILVNNAAAIHDTLIDPGGFWEKPLELAEILSIGLRSGYVASYYAAPLMIKARAGLIAFTSSFGGGCYMHGPAYGAQKAGVDKFAADMAVDLESYGVAAVSLWLGPQLTERSDVAMQMRPGQYEEFMKHGETPEFNGRIIHALASDERRMEYSGQTLITAELAAHYGITEEGGRRPPSHRDLLGSPHVQHPARVI
jgi:NAD(P)-dependent dehydrogenase (short-subunit alcohol dehydrogenase family)